MESTPRHEGSKEVNTTQTIRDLEKSVQTKCNKIRWEVLHSLYQNLLGSKFKDWKHNFKFWTSISVNPFFENFEINLNDQDHRALINKTKSLKPIDVQEMNVSDLKRKDRNWNGFISLSFPEKVNNLCFKAQDGFMPSISLYLVDIVRVSPRVSDSICICGFKISLNHLKRLICSYKHVNLIDFSDSFLLIPDVPDFSEVLINSQIESLSFSGCESSEQIETWDEEYKKFKNLVEGLATSEDLKRSLKNIQFENCQIKSHCLKQLLDENGFRDINLMYIF
ncbi:unnamed protein product [Moneuplotes crassus]|uniref:Uncharacterized protein n=1 Tax=Euplotes crassus TaxID=5936 RepID=A0AAD2CYL0_EUPCR|nr:unnamed protein product [Moneuplotes crassus]